MPVIEIDLLFNFGSFDRNLMNLPDFDQIFVVSLDFIDGGGLFNAQNLIRISKRDGQMENEAEQG